MAYDPVGGRLLLLSKRDQPPRLYGLPLDLALWQHEMEAEFLGEVPGFRPPTRSDILQASAPRPVGVAAHRDGHITRRPPGRRDHLPQPVPVPARGIRKAGPRHSCASRWNTIGPPGTHEEAVGFSLDGHSVIVTTEGRPAPVYRLDLP